MNIYYMKLYQTPFHTNRPPTQPFIAYRGAIAHSCGRILIEKI